ncbi:MAG: OmpA family protein, partial [Deltaproteobacteria bacterium]|nr:OmpA family protein [Deltaproteobacteria bacterium]
DYAEEKKISMSLKDQILEKTALINRLQEKIKNSRSRILTLEQEMARSKREMEAIQSQTTVLRDEKALAEKRARELETKYQAFLADNRQELEMTKDRLKRAEDALHKLSSDYDTLVADLKELKKAKEQLPRLEKTIISKDKALSDLMKRLRDLETQFAREKAINKDLRARLSTRGAKERELQDQLQASQAKLALLEKEINKCRYDISGIQDRLAGLQREKAFTEERVKKLQAKYQSLLADMNELENAKRRIAELEQLLKARNELVARLERQVRLSKEEVARLNGIISGDKVTIERLKRQQMELLQETQLTKTELDRLKRTYDSLISDLKQQIANKEVTIEKFQKRISVTFVDRILFDFGKASISPEGRAILRKVGNILKGVKDRTIRVVGHTDDVPIRPEFRWKFPSNWELSAARAASVVRFFQNQIGLDPRNMEAVGRAFYDPVASNDTPEGRAQNRRVNIIIGPRI